jgi:hypothetical protein
MRPAPVRDLKLALVRFVQNTGDMLMERTEEEQRQAMASCCSTSTLRGNVRSGPDVGSKRPEPSPYRPALDDPVYSLRPLAVGDVCHDAP